MTAGALDMAALNCGASGSDCTAPPAVRELGSASADSGIDLVVDVGALTTDLVDFGW